MKYKGVIFDLDGVICSTDEYHYLAWKALADRLGIPFSREFNNRLRGISRMESLEMILKNGGRNYRESEKEALAAEKNKIYRELLGKMSTADLSAEVKTTLNTLRQSGLKLAIGSSSKNTSFILERIGLDRFFDAPLKKFQTEKIIPCDDGYCTKEHAYASYYASMRCFDDIDLADFTSDPEAHWVFRDYPIYQGPTAKNEMDDELRVVLLRLFDPALESLGA